MPARTQLSLTEARMLVPLRAPHAEERREGDEIEVSVRRATGWLATLASRFFTLPARRTFRLDAVGARVWTLCDGRRPVHEIAASLAADHGWPADRAEQAVLAYLTHLSERRLVGFL